MNRQSHAEIILTAGRLSPATRLGFAIEEATEIKARKNFTLLTFDDNSHLIITKDKVLKEPN